MTGGDSGTYMLAEPTYQTGWPAMNIINISTEQNNKCTALGTKFLSKFY